MLACGELGLEIDYFYSLTAREFANIIKGARQRQEMDLKTSWEQSRRIVHAILIQYQPTNKQGKFKKPFHLTDVMAFPWEKEYKAESEKPKRSHKEAAEFWRKRDELKKGK